jgi:hypothetical protein
MHETFLPKSSVNDWKWYPATEEEIQHMKFHAFSIEEWRTFMPFYPATGRGVAAEIIPHRTVTAPPNDNNAWQSQCCQHMRHTQTGQRWSPDSDSPSPPRGPCNGAKRLDSNQNTAGNLNSAWIESVWFFTFDSMLSGAGTVKRRRTKVSSSLSQT